MKRTRDVILMTGKTGTGKSVLLQRLIKGVRRMILLDVMNEYQKLDPPFPAVYIDGFRDLVDYLSRVRRSDFRIVLSLERPFEPIELTNGVEILPCDLLCKIVYDNLEDVVLVIEELGKYETGRSRAPNLYNIVCLGRHKGISIYATSQRPAQINTDFKAQVTKLYCFKQHLENDIEGIRCCIGSAEEARTLRDLKEFEFGRPMVKGKHYKEYEL